MLAYQPRGIFRICPPHCPRERRRLHLPWGEQEIELYTGDASAAGWPQDSGVLGLLRFDDLEPQYQKRAERLEEGGYVAFFESEAESVFDLRYEELKEQEFFEPEITAEDLEEKAKYWGM